VLSGGSYLSQHDLRVHFGLAAHDHLEQVEIVWPSGKIEKLSNLAADRFYKLKEGQGIVGSAPPHLATKP
jgi:enediyne biosynthesis protein E4